MNDPDGRRSDGAPLSFQRWGRSPESQALIHAHDAQQQRGRADFNRERWREWEARARAAAVEARAFRAADAIKALGRHPIVAHVVACPECHQHARMYCDEGRAIIAAHSAACDAAEEEQREALAALDAARGKR